MIKAVVFDIGETLIDESRIWCRWADRLGIPRFTLLGLIGAMVAADRPFSDAFAMLRPGLDLDAEAAAWRRDDPAGLRENFDDADLYPDVVAGLDTLRRMGLLVVIAGNQPPQAQAALERMRLPVDAIFTSAGWGVEKPEPAFFAHVAQACAVPVESICYVGDRLDNDVLPAAAAGMRTVLLKRGPWGYLHAQRPQAQRAGWILEGLAALPAALRPAQPPGQLGP